MNTWNFLSLDIESKLYPDTAKLVKHYGTCTKPNDVQVPERKQQSNPKAHITNEISAVLLLTQIGLNIATVYNMHKVLII